MEEQLISFETAKLVKEKGFNLKCWNYYDNGGVLRPSMTKVSNKMKLIVAPTQSLLQKWLREKHKLNVIVNLTHGSKIVHYYSVIYNCNVHRPKYIDLYDVNNYIKSYEESLEKGLQKALNLIKK